MKNEKSKNRYHYANWLEGWLTAEGPYCNWLIDLAWKIAQAIKPNGCSWRACGELMAKLMRHFYHHIETSCTRDSLRPYPSKYLRRRDNKR